MAKKREKQDMKIYISFPFIRNAVVRDAKKEIVRLKRWY